MIQKITQEEISKKCIGALPNRPNQSTRYGSGGLSPEELKNRFDALPRLSIDKINELIDCICAAVGEEDGKALAELLQTGIKDPENSDRMMTVESAIEFLYNASENAPKRMDHAEREIEALRSGKADSDRVYGKDIVDAKLQGKANKEDVYTKTETDQKIKEYGAFVFRGNAAGIEGGNIYVDEGKTSFFELKSTDPESGDELYAFTIPPFGNDITVTYRTDSEATETRTYTVGDTVRVTLNGGYYSQSWSMSLIEAQEASGDLYSLGEILTIETVYAYVDSDTGEITNTEKSAKDPETLWGSFSQDYGNKIPVMAAYGAGTTPVAGTGDTWQVGDREYAFNGYEWVELGFNIDLSGKMDKVTSIGYGRVYGITSQGLQVTRDCRDAAVADSLPIRDANGTFQIGAPKIDNNPATKKYVDSAVNAITPAKIGAVPADAESIGTTYTTHELYAYLWDDTDKKVVRRTATRASESIGGYPNGVVCYDSSGHIFIRDDMIAHDGDAVNKKYVDTALGDVSTALAAILGV